MTSPHPQPSWFHCGRCGALFPSQPGDDDARRCPVCGCHPSHDEWHGTAVAGAALPVQRTKPASPKPVSGQPKIRRKRKARMAIWIIVPWLAFMAFLLTVARYFWQKPADSRDPGQVADTADAYLDEKLLKDHLPAVYQGFGAYVVAGSNEQRSQFVADPIRVAPRMARFFELNPLMRLEPEKLHPLSPVVLHLPQGRAIEMLWRSEGGIHETVFIRQDGEWRLDWEHFVRYSDFPFSLFLAGDGPDEAEFRLFARERLAAERRDDPALSVVFYAPVPGKPRETALQSPEFLVARHTIPGKRLAAAFARLGKGARPFASRLAIEDSDDLIRVRVRIRRSSVAGVKSFEIIDLPACHWYGVTEAPGIEVTEIDPKAVGP